MSEYPAFPKIPRLSRDVVITEKIDGTNAQIVILPFDQTGPIAQFEIANRPAREGEATAFSLFAGSRTRYITPESDNFGFAAWVKANADELFKLGPGQHFGEWWGQGIQRTYGLTEKRFSLFNVKRWGKQYEALRQGHDVEAFPRCCHVVPTLGIRTLDTEFIGGILERLRTEGSAAAPGFPRPEGVIVYHTASGQLYKKLLEGDAEYKGQQAA
jgi:hypothetical protein